jgi:signal transduction histidine kinase
MPSTVWSPPPIRDRRASLGDRSKGGESALPERSTSDRSPAPQALAEGDAAMAREAVGVLRVAGRLAGAIEGRAWIVAEEDGRGSLAARWPLGGVGRQLEASLKACEWSLLEASASGGFRWIGDPASCSRQRLPRAAVGADDHRTASIVPVRVGGGVAAVLVQRFATESPPDYRQRRLVEIAAERLGEAIARQRLEAQLQRERRRFEQSEAARAEQAEQLDSRLQDAERWAVVGGFAAGLLHDLTNTLLPIECRLGILAREELTPPAREQVAAMEKDLGLLRRLVLDLRDLAGSGEDRRGRTRVPEWWRRNRSRLLSLLPADANFEATLAPEVGAVAISHARLTVAISHLFGNAASAIGTQGSVRLRADLEPRSRMVRFEVSDDGKGMSEPVRRRALEPFFTTQTRKIGTGLGLSLVRSLVARCGGSVEIESAPGRGTRVAVRLPQAGRAKSAAGLAAVVAVDEPRVAGFVAQVLGQAGAPLRRRLPDSGRWLLVVGGEAARAERVRRLVGRRDGGVVLAVGAFEGEWNLGPLVRIGDATDAVAIKVELERLVEQLLEGER